ncbi:flagellar biosynthetic protein FliO [Undibacterium sp.]|uniref:flagellar biosynthetic protein FliO n=1 Tax=Undibacterium sp. TaxID=1914977 RepID=UPI00374DF6D6
MTRLLFSAVFIFFSGTAFAAEQAAGSLAAVAPSVAPAVSPAVSPSTGLLQIFLGLIAVLALMAVAAWSFKKIGPAVSGNKVPVKVVGGVSVGNRERIMVVEVADQWIVVGVTATQINTLSTMPRQDGLADHQNDTQPVNQFSTWLRRTMDKRNGPQQ